MSTVFIHIISDVSVDVEDLIISVLLGSCSRICNSFFSLDIATSATEHKQETSGIIGIVNGTGGFLFTIAQNALVKEQNTEAFFCVVTDELRSS